jgi:hypothetical protein
VSLAHHCRELAIAAQRIVHSSGWDMLAGAATALHVVLTPP